MRILLDDELLMGIYTDLAQALEAGREQAAAQGRMIAEVFFDGRLVEEEELVRYCNGEDACEAEEIRLQTVNPSTLVRDTLSQAAEALQRVVDLQAQVGEMLQTGDMNQAVSRISEPLELWGKVHQAIVQCGLLMQLDMQEFTVDGVPAVKIVNSLAEHLRQVRDALVNHDEVALADELSYELADEAQRWQKLMSAMMDILVTVETTG